jgi:formamidopyrimidine-DNA glycosylase
MPESPEILYFTVLLNKMLKNKKIEKIKFNTDKPAIIPDDFEGIIKEIDSKGKILWMETTSKRANKKYYIHIHFGITGWIEDKKPKKNIKYEIIIRDENGKRTKIYMEDRRRFSRINIYDREVHEEKINNLGTSIFTKEFTEDKLRQIIRSRKTYIASLIMEQKKISGIGNYIKNEAIYMSGLDARIKSNEITEEEIKKLYKNILYVAYSSLYEQLEERKIKNDFIENYKRYNVNKPEKIEVPYKFRIYGRERTEDNKKIKKIKVAGRDSYIIE